MKMKFLTTFAILSMTSAVLAACPKADKLKTQQEAIDLESKKLTIVADYLNSRISERGGEYENSRTLGMLMMETRTKSLNLATQSGRLQIKISNESLNCLGVN
jgi:hypothetical protein